jgi:hypothetical protein
MRQQPGNDRQRAGRANELSGDGEEELIDEALAQKR